MAGIARGLGVFWLIAGFALAAAGCAEAPHSGAMTVSLTAPTVAASHSLKVEPISGGKQTEGWDKPSLGNDEFQEALVASLTKSLLFQRVTVTEPAEWSLRATIISQEMRGAWRNTAELMVRYDITDASGQSLWGDTVYTNKEMGPGDIFAAQERTRVLIESAARDNISNALERMHRWLEKAPAREPQKS